jgi:cyanophycinase-like exopeptidase
MAKIEIAGAPPAGTLALIGGGEFSFGETRDIDSALLQRLPPSPTIAFLPTASGSSEYGAHFGKYLGSIRDDIRFVNVPIYRKRDARREKNILVVHEASMVYLGGGVTGHIAGVLGGSPIVDSLRAVLLRGGVVAAIGGAASALGILTRPTAIAQTAVDGVGLLETTVIETAFDRSNDVPLRRLMSDPRVQQGIGIPFRTAFFLERDGGTIEGAETVAVYRKPKQ